MSDKKNILYLLVFGLYVFLFILLPIYGANLAIDDLLESKTITIDFSIAKHLTAFFLLIVFVFEFLKKIIIADLKPFILLPNTMKIKLKNSIKALFIDINFYLSFLPFISILSCIIIRLDMFPDGIFLLLSVIGIYIVLVINVWAIKAAFKFSKNQKLKILCLIQGGITVVVVLLLLTKIPMIYISVIVLLFFLFTTRFIFDKIEELLNYVFDRIEHKNREKELNFKIPGSNKLVFFLKEYRMITRSKRLRVFFWLNMVCFIGFSISLILFFDRSPKKAPISIYFIMLSIMNFAEYYERLWAWDRKNIGFILSLPLDRKIYLIQKFSFAILLGLYAFLVHFVFLHKYIVFALLVAILSIVSFPVIGGYRSFFDEKMKVDLNLVTRDIRKLDINKSFALVSISIIVLNWFIFVNYNFLALKIIYVLLLAVINFILIYRLFNKFKLKEF